MVINGEEKVMLIQLDNFAVSQQCHHVSRQTQLETATSAHNVRRTKPKQRNVTDKARKLLLTPVEFSLRRQIMLCL